MESTFRYLLIPRTSAGNEHHHPCTDLRGVPPHLRVAARTSAGDRTLDGASTGTGSGALRPGAPEAPQTGRQSAVPAFDGATDPLLPAWAVRYTESREADAGGEPA